MSTNDSKPKPNTKTIEIIPTKIDSMSTNSSKPESKPESQPEPNTKTIEIKPIQTESSIPTNLDWQRGQTFAPPKEDWEKAALQSFEKIFYLTREIDGYMEGLAKRGVHTTEGCEWYCSLGGKSDAARVLVHDRMLGLMGEFRALESAMKTGKAGLS